LQKPSSGDRNEVHAAPISSDKSNAVAKLGVPGTRKVSGRDTVAEVFHRVLAAALLIACTTEPEPSQPPPHFVYAPALPKWQLGPLAGRFGRGQEPQAARVLGIGGDPKVPLRLASVWPLPGEPARAVVYGLEGTQPAIELHEVDAGRVVWRTTTACVEAVIGVTDKTIVCGGAKGVRGVSLAGKPVWTSDQPLVAITKDRIVVGNAREAITLDANDGKELARVRLPAGIELTQIVASCDRELFAFGGDRLARIINQRGVDTVTWQQALVPGAGEVPPLLAPLPRPGLPRPPPPPRPSPALPAKPSTVAIESIDCSIEPMIVATRPLAKPEVVETERLTTLHAIRSDGKATGTITNVRGFWPARGEVATELEVSADGAVTRWPRDLSAPIAGLALPPLGPLLDARGDRRLISATPFTAAVIDRGGVRAYVPLAATSGALGKDAIVAPAAASRGSGVRRIAIPSAPRHAVRVPARRAGVAPAAELRDLPAAVELPMARTIAKPDTGKHAAPAIALDPKEPAAVYAIALERPPTSTTTATVARADLAKGTWSWQRSDGCGQGEPIGLAVATGIVACAARGTESTVRATTREGASAWERTLDQIDAIEGGGTAVLAYDADRLIVLDAETGRILGRVTSDDGFRVRAAIVTAAIPGALPPADTTWLVTFERGRLVGRLPAVSMIAAWSLEVDGLVTSIAASGEGVLVTLEDGDAYRIELATRAVTPMPGLGLTWRANGELVTGETRGGPIPGIPGPVPPRVPVRVNPRPAPSDRNPEAPDLWIPIAPPPPLGESWQYTLYERSGALRARNDYGLAAPVTATRIRGPVGSPLVVISAGRDVVVLDARTGDPVRRATLPQGAPGIVFGTIVEGAPVAGTVLASPLRVVLF
jgi:hypothetical protein